MEFSERIYTILKQIPFLGNLTILVVFVYGLNEVITKATFDKINPLKSILGFLPTFKKYRLNIIKAQYYNTLNTKEFIEWRDSVLAKLYNVYPFTKLCNSFFPVVCFNAYENFAYPFIGLLNEEELNLNVQDYKLNLPIQKGYKIIVGDTVKRPLLKGYMLSSFKLNDNDHLISVSAHVGTYEQNIYSSHILEYELYKYYINKKHDIQHLTPEQILSYLPLRKLVHKNRSQKDILVNGDDRSSLLGVQALVMFKDHEDLKYKVFVIKRSDDVASKPGYYQFIPSGGFEIWQNDDNDDILKNNFSVRHAIFRELIEEVFGEEEFVDNKVGMPESNILNHPKVQFILNLIFKKQASFQFLGSCVDLVGLRHELSFILRIDDPEFSKLSFHPNHESKNIQIKSLSQVKNIVNEKLNQGSAGLLHLASKHHIFKEIARDEGIDFSN